MERVNGVFMVFKRLKKENKMKEVKIQKNFKYKNRN